MSAIELSFGCTVLWRVVSFCWLYALMLESFVLISVTEVGSGPQHQQIIEHAIVFHFGSMLRLMALIKSALNASI